MASMEPQDPRHPPGDRGHSLTSLGTPRTRGNMDGSGTGTLGWHRIGAGPRAEPGPLGYPPARGTPGSVTWLPWRKGQLLLVFRLLVSLKASPVKI